MYSASYIKHTLKFITPAVTSRGWLSQKDSWFIKLSDRDQPGICGIGECSIIPGLSLDDHEDLDLKIDHICKLISMGQMPVDQELPGSPSIGFALETALQDLRSGGRRVLFPTSFTEGKEGITINGLIWMGDKAEILEQVAMKVEEGFHVLKMKVGALDFDSEMGLLRIIRKQFGTSDLEIRLDANGAWEVGEAIEKMKMLEGFRIHSLEQPVKSGQQEGMARVCRESSIPVALDEELIGKRGKEEKEEVLDSIRPDYIIIKPGLLGGFRQAGEWIALAEERETGWWVTSALESNIGLNAIAQWTATLDPAVPQGLGTGMLYQNNIPSPLTLQNDKIFHLPGKNWELPNFLIP